MSLKLKDKKNICSFIFKGIIIYSILYIIFIIFDKLYYYLKFTILSPYHKKIVINNNINILNTHNQNILNLYYINLNESKNRNKRFLRRIPNLINPIRIEAVTPKELPNIKLPIICNMLSKKLLACTTSHLKAIHKAYTDNNKYAMISEDDMIILKNINWDLLVSLAPNDWDIIQLHTCCIPISTKNYNPIYKYNNSNTLFLKAKNKEMIASAACYLISRKGMKLLLSRYITNYNKDWEKLQDLDFTYINYDCAADSLIFYDLNRYICTKILIDVDGIDSTLHTSHLKFHNITKDYIQKNIN